MGSSDGSTLQSVGLHVIATMPRSPRIGRRRRASAMDTKSIGTPAVRPRSTSRASCSASWSVRAILSAPLWVKRSGWPVSSVNAARFETARAARVALGAVLVGDDTSRRGVSAQEPEHPVASDAEAVRGVGRNRERVALLEHDRLVLAAFDPRLGGAVQDVEDLDVGMRVQRRL